MFHMIRTLSVISLITVAGASFAQDNASADSTAAEGELQVGQTYIREKSGDWDLRCLKDSDESDPCQIYQLLLNADGNAVAEFTMVPLFDGGEAAAGANLISPLETYLPAGVSIAIDGGVERRYDFTFCNIEGCVSRMGFTADDIELMKKGSQATVKLVPAASETGEPIVLSLSLSGFTAAYAMSSETLKPAE